MGLTATRNLTLRTYVSQSFCCWFKGHGDSRLKALVELHSTVENGTVVGLIRQRDGPKTALFSSHDLTFTEQHGDETPCRFLADA